MSLRDQIKAADDHRSETVACPEWGCDVVVRSISAGERNAMIQKFKNVDDPTSVGIATQGEIIVKSCYTADGSRVFEDADLEWLWEKSPEVIDRLAAVAFKVSGMDKGAVEAGKDGSSSKTPTNSTSST